MTKLALPRRLKLRRSLGLGANLGMSGGGGEDYVAKAITTDGTQVLINELVSSTDNGFCGIAFYFKKPTITGNEELFVTDPNGEFTNSFDIAPSTPYFNFHLKTETGVDTYSTLDGPVDVSSFVGTNWHSYIAAAKTDENSGSKILRVKIDGMDVSPAVVDVDPSFNVTFNGLPLYVLDDGFGEGFVGSIADLRIGIGQNWLTGGDISAPTVALFRNPVTGLPVDPAVATAALGTPAVLFQRTIDPLSFGNNQGTGGLFTWTGTPTDGGVVS